MTSPFDSLIQQVADTYGLDFGLLQAQVLAESSFNPNALKYERDFFEHRILGKSADEVPGVPYGPLAACSYGLLQILYETALEHGFTDRPERLFEPRVGLAWGAKYLQTCLRRANGDYHLALVYYNGIGPAAVAYANRVYQLAGRTV